MDAQPMLMTYRPMSQMLRFYVVPEIEARVASGKLGAADLPFQVLQFRFVQADGQNLIEINEDVRLIAKVRVNRAMNAGESLTLADLNPDECFLQPPTLNGKPAAFFLCVSSFMNFTTMFDFTPNAPSNPDDPVETRPMLYPIAEFAEVEQMLKAMRPVEMFRQLAAASWPPGPGHYPHVLSQVHHDPASLQQAALGDVVAASFDEKYWKRQLDFWTETTFFGDRMTYVKKAVDEYLAGDYVSSIYVLVPHFEGIVKDYLTSTGAVAEPAFMASVKQLKALVLSRKVLMFPRPVLDLVFTFIEAGTFLTNTGNINDPGKEVTRHGIAHGVFKNFENRDITLKYLILLDSLAYVLMHDKLLAGTL